MQAVLQASLPGGEERSGLPRSTSTDRQPKPGTPGTPKGSKTAQKGGKGAKQASEPEEVIVPPPPPLLAPYSEGLREAALHCLLVRDHTCITAGSWPNLDVPQSWVLDVFRAQNMLHTSTEG